MELLFKEQIGNVVFIERDVYRYVLSLLEEIENTTMTFSSKN